MKNIVSGGQALIKRSGNGGEHRFRQNKPPVPAKECFNKSRFGKSYHINDYQIFGKLMLVP